MYNNGKKEGKWYLVGDDVVKEVETTIDKVSLQHNVKTDVVYDYIDKELGRKVRVKNMPL